MQYTMKMFGNGCFIVDTCDDLSDMKVNIH